MVWGTFFSMFARLTEGGGALKLFGQCPYRTNIFQKGASLILPDIWFAQALEQIGEDRTECAS